MGYKHGLLLIVCGAIRESVYTVTVDADHALFAF